MHFSSMAVSILAQSVPLLAVGHHAGWKKRDERSWLQSRRLHDALPVGVLDKKGIVIEKHGEVQVRQVNILDKKRAGSASLVQDTASSEVSPDDREVSVECDPLSKVTDSGIVGCGMDSHCVKNEESTMGGFCVDIRQATSVHRALQLDPTCNEGPDQFGSTCNCSQFNNTSGVGTYTCIYPQKCLDESKELCYYTDGIFTANADGSFDFEQCGEWSGEVVDEAAELESYCYSKSGNVNSSSTFECEIKANGVVCNSCEVNQAACPAGSFAPTGTVFDCTNTVLKVEGVICNMSARETFLVNAGVLPMPAPLETRTPTVSPTSSGSSLTAKVTIVASAAATAWMAAFGT